MNLGPETEKKSLRVVCHSWSNPLIPDDGNTPVIPSKTRLAAKRFVLNTSEVKPSRFPDCISL